MIKSYTPGSVTECGEFDPITEICREVRKSFKKTLPFNTFRFLIPDTFLSFQKKKFKAMPLLVTRLEEDPSATSRATAAWVLGCFADHITSGAVHKEEFSRIVNSLIEGFGQEPQVAEKCYNVSYESMSCILLSSCCHE